MHVANIYISSLFDIGSISVIDIAMTLFTAFTAFGTIWAAFAASKSARAAQNVADQSQNQWREQAVYNNIILLSGDTRSRLPFFINNCIKLCDTTKNSDTFDFELYEFTECGEEGFVNPDVEPELRKLNIDIEPSLEYVEQNYLSILQGLIKTLYISKDYSSLSKNHTSLLFEIFRHLDGMIATTTKVMRTLPHGSTSEEDALNVIGTGKERSNYSIQFLSIGKLFSLYLDHLISQNYEEDLEYEIDAIADQYLPKSTLN